MAETSWSQTWGHDLQPHSEHDGGRQKQVVRNTPPLKLQPVLGRPACRHLLVEDVRWALDEGPSELAAIGEKRGPVDGDRLHVSHLGAVLFCN